MTEPVMLAIVAQVATILGAIVAGFFAIWKLMIEMKKNTVAATAALTATTATKKSLEVAAAKLDSVHAILAADPSQAELKTEIALLGPVSP